MLGSSVQIDRADRRTVIRHIVRKEIIAASTHIRGVSAVDDIILIHERKQIQLIKQLGSSDKCTQRIY